MSNWLANRYWLIWFVVMLTTFLVPELYSIVTKRFGGTLSDTIWRMEDLVPNQSIWKWTAGHYLFTFGFILIVVWLIAHFGWGLFR